MAVSNRIPPELRGPIGVASLGIMIMGFVVGYILTVVGVTVRFNLNGKNLPPNEAYIIIAIGLGCIVLGYLGWKGFLAFGY